MDRKNQEKTSTLLRRNFLAAKASASLLVISIVFGTVSYLLWERTNWEEGACLLALLLLASFDKGTSAPLSSNPSPRSRVFSWLLLLLAFLGLLATWQTTAAQEQSLFRHLCKHGSLLLLAFATSMRFDGARTAASFLPLYLLGFVLLPLYEVILLEISYPLRLLSTAIAAQVLRLCAIPVVADGATMLWGSQVISMTDACSGIALLSFLAFLEYLVARPVVTAAWKKWCWGSLLLLWVIIGNSLRLLLTFALYAVMGDAVFHHVPHFLLGCAFIVITSLLIWFSSFSLSHDEPKQEQP